VSALAVHSLSVAYSGRPALLEADLEVAAGQVCGVVGRTGSGKSTLARTALGLLPTNAEVTTGTVEVLGAEIKPDDERAWVGLRHRRVAYVPQQARASLHPYLRVGRQLEDVLSEAETPNTPRGLLEQVQLRDPERVLKARPHELSGGMAQRVAIAISIAADPEVIVADEPTSGLDVTIQRDILELLTDVSRGRTLVIITHDIGVVRHFCGAVAVLHGGRVVEQGSVPAVLEEPSHPYTRELLST
jgi:ABC-type dipeptide/oligopeptide/nickel transport system ATPase component